MIFDTRGLLHKHGFEDGDILFDWVKIHFKSEDIKINYKTKLIFHQDLLIMVLLKHVVPKITSPSFKLGIVQTSHNPLRIYEIDGNTWFHTPGKPLPHINPQEITVEEKEIIQEGKILLLHGSLDMNEINWLFKK